MKMSKRSTIRGSRRGSVFSGLSTTANGISRELNKFSNQGPSNIRRSVILFQAKPPDHEKSYIDYPEIYELERFCLARLSDDSHCELMNRELFVTPEGVDIQFKFRELPKKINYTSIGFCLFTVYVTGVEPDDLLDRISDIISLSVHGYSRMLLLKKDFDIPERPLVLMENGRQAFLLHEGGKNAGSNFWFVRIVEAVSPPYNVELQVLIENKQYYLLIDSKDLKALVFHPVICPLSKKFQYDIFSKLIEELSLDKEFDCLQLDSIQRSQLDRYSKEAISANNDKNIWSQFDETQLALYWRDEIAKSLEPSDAKSPSKITMDDCRKLSVRKVSAATTSEGYGEEEGDDLLIAVDKSINSFLVNQLNSRLQQHSIADREFQKQRSEVFMRRISTVVRKRSQAFEFDERKFSNDVSVFSDSEEGKVMFMHLLESLKTPSNKRRTIMIEIIINMLKSCHRMKSHLACCCASDLKKLATVCTISSATDNYVYAKRKESIDCCFIVLEGSIWMRKKRFELSETSSEHLSTTQKNEADFARKGDFIGEELLRNKCHWSYDLFSVGDTIVCILPATIVRQYVGWKSSTSKDFIKCFWKFNRLWNIAEHYESTRNFFADHLLATDSIQTRFHLGTAIHEGYLHQLIETAVVRTYQPNYEIFTQVRRRGLVIVISFIHLNRAIHESICI